jgi:putative drug exporter of the RND superfamily
MFKWLATFVSRHWLLILAAWVIVPAVICWFAPRWDDVAQDGDFAYLPARMTSSRAGKLVAEAFPDQKSKSEVVLVVARRGGKLRAEDYAVADRLAVSYAPKEGVESPVTDVWSYDEPVLGRKLISALGPNGQAVLVMLHIKNELMVIDNIPLVLRIFKDFDAMRQEPAFPKGLELGVTGSAAIGSEMLVAMGESIKNTEMTTIAMVVLILLLVYRAPGLVVVPLLAIGVSFVVSTNMIAIFAQWSQHSGWLDYRVFKTSKIFIVVILYGAATDYCLFLIARYREELEHGLSPADAIREALGRTGHAVTASAMTTILGLGAMIFADFGKFSNGGPTIAVSLVVALLACITAAPALLCGAGSLVFWPFGVGPQKKGRLRIFSRRASAAPARPGLPARFWERLAHLIVTRPGTIIITAFILLCLPAYAGFHVPITYDLLSQMKSDRVSVRGTRLLEQFFPTGETGPIMVLAFDTGLDFSSDAQRQQISLLTREFYKFTYTDSHGLETHPILSVRSLTNPLGDAPGAFSPFTPAGRRRMAAVNHPRTKAMFLAAAPGYAGHVVRFDLICQYDPFSHESTRLLGAIDERLKALSRDPASNWRGTSFDFAGTTAGIRDLEEVNTSDTLRIGVLVSLAVLGVLIFLLRRPLVSCYLIFTVLVGYFVSMGITKLFFMWLFGPSFQGLDWQLPLFLFVILVAVGEDYNIYLVTRVFEEQKRLGPLEGLRYAVVRTGGIITSCGVIMAGTFASMLSGTLLSMYELGFSLALGVLLDTFIIRTILVPAFLALWARWFPDKCRLESQPEPLRGPHFDPSASPAFNPLPDADRMVG